MHFCRVFIFAGLLLGCLLGCANTKTPTKNIYAHYEQAVDAYNEGRFSDAEPLLRKLLKQYPQFAEGWFRLGNLYVRTGENEAALTAFKTCLRYEPGYIKASYNLGLVHLKMAVAVLDDGLLQKTSDSADYSQLVNFKKAILNASTQRSK